jgi:outer membrane protein OmpA-like peptidoglycan-associated protein
MNTLYLYLNSNILIVNLSKQKIMKKLSVCLWVMLYFNALHAQDYKDKSIWQFDIFFESGKSDIQQTDVLKLDSVSVAMLTDTNYHVKIAAHTDNTGSDMSNERLSKKRAEIIQTYIRSKGLDSARFALTWRGEIDPIADNTTDVGKSKNRRATVTLIRRIYLAQITSIVKNDSGQVVPNALVYMTSPYLSDSTNTDSTGSFTLKVPFKQPVVIEVTAKDHFYDRKFLNLGVLKVKLSDFSIALVTLNKRLKIKDLIFQGNLPILVPESEPHLKIILKFMRLNPSYKIQIDGHVHGIGFIAPENSFEYQLSVQRAQFVYNYLAKSGIAKERMTYKGYANWEMLYPNATNEVQMSANRRVEIRVVAK